MKQLSERKKEKDIPVRFTDSSSVVYPFLQEKSWGDKKKKKRHKVVSC